MPLKQMLEPLKLSDNHLMPMLEKCYNFLTIPRMVFCVFFIVLIACMPLDDPDYYWHIKTGEYIFGHHLLPRQDIFSFTMPGHPWVLHEWLFQVLLFLVFASFGTIGIKSFSVALTLSALYLSYRISRELSSVRITTVVMLLLVPLLIAPFLSPRPQLFSYLFFSYYLYGLLSFKYFHKVQYLYTFPLVMILWVNLHGGYIVGIALLFFFALTEFLSNFLIPENIKKKRTALLLPFGIALLSLAASSLNPDFIDHWKYPFQVMSMEAAKNFISEWQSPGFHDWFGKLYLLFVFAFFVANIYRKNRPDLTELLIPLFFITEGFIAARHMPFAVLSTIPFLAAALNNRMAITFCNPFENYSLKRFVSTSKSAPTKDLGNIEYLLNWLILLLASFTILLAAPSIKAWTAEKINKNIPVAAVDFVVDKKIQGRFFNTYGFGGYLIYRLYPEQKVFIDGRADMYGDDFMKKYKTIDRGLPGWEKEFDQYDIDYVVCKRTAPIRQLLLIRGDFGLVYDDEYNSVLVKNMPRFANLIAEFDKSKSVAAPHI